MQYFFQKYVLAVIIALLCMVLIFGALEFVTAIIPSGALCLLCAIPLIVVLLLALLEVL